MMERIDRLSNHFLHESLYWRAIFSGFSRLKEPRSPDQNKFLALTKASIKVELISMQSVYIDPCIKERGACIFPCQKSRLIISSRSNDFISPVFLLHDCAHEYQKAHTIL